LKRGEAWTVAGGADYAGKPRPAVILQDERFPTSMSITICVFTTDLTEASMFRVRVEPTKGNGLLQPSCLMADKISTVPRTKMGKRIGKLSAADMKNLNRAVALFLGLAE
jgi:mRNA interferase MazF